MQEHIRLAQIDDFFGQHLKDIAEHLERSPRSDAHRAKAALEEGTNLTLHVNQNDGKHCIQRDDGQCHQHGLCQDSGPFRHYSGEQSMQPF